jgi:hypothetical protein
LDLHNIKLQKQDEQAIRTYFEKNGGYLKYKEVLHHIQINKEMVDPLNSHWVFLKPTQKL